MEYVYKKDTTYISDCCYNIENSIVYHHEIMVDSIYKNFPSCYAVADFNQMKNGGVRSIYDKTTNRKIAQESLGQDWESLRREFEGKFYYLQRFIYSIKPSSNDPIGGWGENEFSNR